MKVFINLGLSYYTLRYFIFITPPPKNPALYLKIIKKKIHRVKCKESIGF